MAIHGVLNIGLLKPYQQLSSSFPLPQPQPIIVDGELEWEIEAIKSHWTVHGKQQYLVSWAGVDSSEDQWVLESELENARQLLSDYRRS